MQADAEQALLVEEPSSEEDEVIDYEVAAHMASGCACGHLCQHCQAKALAGMCRANAIHYLCKTRNKKHNTCCPHEEWQIPADTSPRGNVLGITAKLHCASLLPSRSATEYLNATPLALGGEGARPHASPPSRRRWCWRRCCSATWRSAMLTPPHSPRSRPKP